MYRAGTIGRTGRGNFGHDLDRAFEGFPNIQLVAVADDNPEGLAAAGQRLGVDQLYADYRAMLAAERLDLVSVGPRWIDCHAEMVIACAEAGVKGILCEKPLARTLAEADAMLEACERHGVRLAVAHRRANAYEQYAKQMVDAGAIGTVQVMRGHGKEDHRGGAMDLTVLGTHILDSMRYIAGADVAWAHGHVTQGGRDITVADIREGDEAVGLLAGDGVAAYYVFQNGITAHYESYRGTPETPHVSSRSFGFEIYGTEGILALRNSPIGELYLHRGGLWMPDDTWERIILDEWEKLPDGQPRSEKDKTRLSNTMIVTELVQAIEAGREVVACSSGQDSRAALEMVMAVFESQRVQGRVDFPLQNRDNPFVTWLG